MGLLAVRAPAPARELVHVRGVVSAPWPGSPEYRARQAASYEAEQALDALAHEAERRADAAGILDELARLRGLGVEIGSAGLDLVLAAYYRGVDQ